MNAKIGSNLVKTVEPVKIYLGLSNAPAKMDMKDSHVRIHATLTRIIVNTEALAKIKLVYMIVIAKGQGIKESVAVKISMNAMLKVHAKTTVSAKMRKVVFPVIAKTLHSKGTIVTNLNTVSMVLLD